MKTTIRSNIEDIRKNNKDILSKYQDTYKNYSRQFSVTPIKEKNNNSYYFIFKIPSTSLKKRALEYDIIIEILNTVDENTNIFDKPIRVFSNSPSFTYTSAYVFNKNKLLIPWMKNKYNKTILTNPPKIRNPQEKVELDQSVMIALLHLSTLYKYSDMESDSRYIKRLFRNNINRQTVYRSISTALEKTDENKEEKKKQTTRNQRRKRVISTLKNPTSILSRNTNDEKSRSYSSSGTNKRKTSVNKVTKKTARKTTRKKK